MRNANGDGGAVLPWLLIRQDGLGNRYRVGSYATRDEAEQVADRLESGTVTSGADAGAYLVESRDGGSGARG
ncbi:SPOR domain-containing protein [Streptomyces sp. DSM 42041]|uniref:SPOR domain-containing protein n=1 Tax=Streptomyces hazeniae TaxID=3075538 RepID=A0ABU2NLU0_9ACTN|nr:hypothetical protein [Streptomyces sp. DSM 42041]MDT0377945.1 SPOR domain-containing protein [Streptomyces sp. DSM 42041]